MTEKLLLEHERDIIALQKKFNDLEEYTRRCAGKINYLLTERELMAKTQADLQTSITALETEVAALKAVPAAAAPDLTNEVARVDAVTAEIKAMIPAPTPPAA